MTIRGTSHITMYRLEWQMSLIPVPVLKILNTDFNNDEADTRTIQFPSQFSSRYRLAKFIELHNVSLLLIV